MRKPSGSQLGIWSSRPYYGDDDLVFAGGINFFAGLGNANSIDAQIVVLDNELSGWASAGIAATSYLFGERLRPRVR